MFHRAKETVLLFGLPISNVTTEEAVAQIESFVLSGRSHQIATANLDFARNALNDPNLQRILCDCSMVVADGAPFLWASRLIRKPLPERVTGVDLIPRLAQLSAERGYSIYLLGSTEQSSRGAERFLRNAYPKMNVAGRYCPPIGSVDGIDDDEILRRIDAARPDILLVAFGNPKQEIWIRRNLNRMSVPVAIGIGGSLDIISGSLQRAPRWMRDAGLEWAFRCAQEPARLFPRYAKDAAALARRLPMGLLTQAIQPREEPGGAIMSSVQRGTCILHVPASLNADCSTSLLRHVEDAVAMGTNPVVDLTATRHITAQGLAALLEVRRMMRANGKPVLFTGMRPSLQRVCRMSAVMDLIPIAAASAEMILSEDLSQGWSQPLPVSNRKTHTLDTATN